MINLAVMIKFVTDSSKIKKKLFIVLKKEWVFWDVSKNKIGTAVNISLGKYEVKAMKNPVKCLDKYPWLVIKGTKTGTAEKYLREKEGSEGDDEVVFVEE